MDKRALRIKESIDKILEMQHAKDPDNFSCAKLKITAPDESDLYEITLTCIKTLDHNGAWDFQVEHSDNANIIVFKYNGGVIVSDALSKQPKFSCEHKIQLQYYLGREFDI